MKGSTNASNVGSGANGSVICRDPRKTMGTTPSSELYTVIELQDKDGNMIGSVGQIQFTDGACRTYLTVRRNAQNTASFDLQINPDGTVYMILEKTVNGAYSSKLIDSL